MTALDAQYVAADDTSAPLHKIVHVDMDAFYASVEQRDNPALRGKPVVVAWRGNRSVVCAASYEARRYGVRSAMPAVRAERLCPEAIFIPPDFVRYKAASSAVRAIFQRHTDLIEPLSLDEAYLDVTENKMQLPTATRVAKMIRQQICEELNLTASAGVAPNKFLAKIASDWKKPNGLFVIQPHEVQSFLLPLPVGRIPGVGQVTESRMKAVGIATVGDLYAFELSTLEDHFGSYGLRLYQLARGIDHNPVVPNRVSKSISAEDAFPEDIPLVDTESQIRRLAEKVWKSSHGNARAAKTVVLKLKTKEFNSLTRSLTLPAPPSSCDELTDIALALRERVELGPKQLFRLVGVGLSNFQTADDPISPLFVQKPVQDCRYEVTQGDQMDEWFGTISAGGQLPALAAKELRDIGFVVISGPVSTERLPQFAAAYDAAMQSGNEADGKEARTTTRMYDFVNRGAEFDDLYTYPPLLEACCHVIGAPFKLSTTLGRTLRQGSAAQDLHVDIKRDSEDLPMVGFILMIDDFRPDNGATRFVPTSHMWPEVPEEVVRDLQADYDGQVLACGRAGSLIIFNGSVWHGHTANATNEARRSIQGYFVRREVRSGIHLPARMRPETLARVGPLARYVLAI